MQVVMTGTKGREIAAVVANALDFSISNEIESAHVVEDSDNAQVSVRIEGRWYVLQLWEVC